MRCDSWVEAWVKDVVHPRDAVSDSYNFDCARRDKHRVHKARTWNPEIIVSWTDDYFWPRRILRATHNSP